MTVISLYTVCLLDLHIKNKHITLPHTYTHIIITIIPLSTQVAGKSSSAIDNATRDSVLLFYMYYILVLEWVGVGGAAQCECERVP